ncbi:MAG: starch-binding protein [Butyrivibrio sp.]|nr:starch-binding protein [Butyrivibrio sp.]
MKKGNLWKRVLFTTGLGLSIFLNSFGNVTGVQAAELPEKNNALEIQNQSETEASDEEKVTDESTEEVTEEVTGKVNGEVTEDASEDAIEETEGEEATTSEEDSTGDAVWEADGEFLSTAESCEGEYTVSLAEAATVKKSAPRDRKASDNAEVNKENVHDGAILQAFCWSFNTIADNMAAIADAGYTAVQTSPINECLDTNPGKNLHGPDGMWYYHYQPTDWVIGNYQLGTRDEFKHMCDVADQYGIAVIVDILPNHTTTSINNVSEDLFEAAGGRDSLYHTTGMTAGGYTDRLELTYYQMGGLPDVDTENISFQEYFYEFLKDCVYLGADGFRIDTAKHIALPDDPVPADYEDTDRNTFYPNMRQAIDEYAAEVGSKSYDDLFVYGEVLQGSADRLPAYQEYIGGTTASNYGASLRSALASGDLSVNKISDYQIYDETVGDRTYTADTEKLITWVESHDNYMNDSESCWRSINDEQVVLGWAFIAARKDGTPLFFSRPDGSSAENPYGNNQIGAAGSDIYRNPAVKAVNLFRRQMLDADEYISNPGGNIQTVMVERLGEDVQGAVIINSGLARTTVNTETKLADGTYRNMVEGNDDIFLVKDGVLFGSIAARSVVVLSDKQEGTGTVVSFYNSEKWDNVVARVDGADETLESTNDNDGWFWVTVLDDEFEIRFENSDGSLVSPSYSVTAQSGTFATYASDALYFSKEEAERAIGIATYPVYFFGTEAWQKVNVYGWLSDGTQLFGGWPGTAAVSEGEGWYRADVKASADADSFNLIFNNGSDKQTENIEGITPESKDIYVAVDAERSSGQLAVDRYTSKEDAENALGVSGSFTTAYFYNTEGWENVYAYSWGATALGPWPGTEMTLEEDGWYKIVLNAGAGEELNIIFNNGDGKQTSDMKITDMKNRFILHNGIAYQKYGTKKDALAAIATGDDVEYTTVYFYNEQTDDEAWQDVALYIYGGENGEYNNLIGGWPGKSMDREEGTNWYSVSVPSAAIETHTLTYIFNNNGGGSQLADNKDITREKSYFTSSSTDSFASKEAVLAFLGISTEDPEQPGDEPEQPGDDSEKPGTEEPGEDPSIEPGNEDPAIEEPTEPEQPQDPEQPEEPEEPTQPEPTKPVTPVKPILPPVPPIQIIIPVMRAVRRIVTIIVWSFFKFFCG